MAKRRLVEGLRSILQRQEDAVSDDDDGECVYVKNYCTFATKLTVRRIRCLYYIIVIILQNRNQKL